MKQRTVKVVLFAAFLTLVQSAWAADAINVTIQGSKSGRIAIVAKEFQYELSPRDVASGQSSGKRIHKPATIIMNADKVAALTALLKSHEVLSSVVFEFVRSNAQGQKQVYQTVKLSDATIESIKATQQAAMNSRQNPNDRRAIPSPELIEISFNFKKIEYSHKDGKPSASDDWKK